MKIYLLIILLSLLSNIAYSDADLDSQLELADQGSADAQLWVGVMYQYGIGALENDKAAVMWYATVIKRPLCNG